MGSLRTRAWWGSQLIAESDDTVAVEGEGVHAALCFPREDVRLELFEEDPDGATWTIPGTVTSFAALTWGGQDLPPVVDGKGAVRTAPDGRLVFDNSRVRLEVVDVMEGNDPRDVTTKRFPPWGTSQDLIDLIRVRPDGENQFVGEGRFDPLRPVVEGSQMLGQAIYAAGQLAPGRRVVSAYMVFLRGADSRFPVAFELEQLTTGRTFTSFAVRVLQGARQVAFGTLLLDVTAPDLISHQDPAPDVTGPYDSSAMDMGVTGRDLRVVDAAYTHDPAAPVGPPVIDAWVRFAAINDDDPALHTGLLAQFTGHVSIAAALRAHEGISEAEAHRTISTAINAITLSVHADIRADAWMLYHHRSTFAGAGMTHSQCTVHDEAGTLLASFTVEAMVRGFADPNRPVDARSAM